MNKTIFRMLLATGLAAILIVPVGCTKEVETTTEPLETTSVQTFPKEATLAEAQAIIGVEIPTPHYLPDGYSQSMVTLVNEIAVSIAYRAPAKGGISLRIQWDPAGLPAYRIDLSQPTLELKNTTAQLEKTANNTRATWNWIPERYPKSLFGFELTAPKELTVSELIQLGNSIAFTDTNQISVSPFPGAFLLNPQGVSSQVLLRDTQLSTGVSDRQYSSPSYRGSPTVKAGELTLVVIGNVQNKHNENTEVAIYAEGYDETGKQVAWTLDTTHLTGQIVLRRVNNGEVRDFTLHLNMADTIVSIRIFANSYDITPP